MTNVFVYQLAQFNYCGKDLNCNVTEVYVSKYQFAGVVAPTVCFTEWYTNREYLFDGLDSIRVTLYIQYMQRGGKDLLTADTQASSLWTDSQVFFLYFEHPHTMKNAGGEVAGGISSGCYNLVSKQFS